MRREVLERDAELSVLADAVRAAVGGAGSVVLVMGEAGIGKSSLVEALRVHLPAEGRMFAGYCDDLATPRTLGPFRDLVGSVGTELSRAVADGSDRDRVLAALRAELSWPEHPTVLVVEDIHWAGEPIGGRLMFAGEHTLSARMAYADGAMTSGIREAKRLLSQRSIHLGPITASPRVSQ